MERLILIIAICASAFYTAETSSADAVQDTNSSKNLPRIKYMKELQSTLAGSDGRPLHKNISLDPTSVLCLADYGEKIALCACIVEYL